jgi:hypothetical protein
MKKISTCILLFFMMYTGKAQSDSLAIVGTIQTFFKGMQSWDTAIINTSLDSTIFFYSIAQDKNGHTVLSPETRESFYTQVTGLKGRKYAEQLLSYDIKTDGNLAMVWSPYKFYFEGNFSHCGTDVFTLVKRDIGWKILGITDTRRRTGCD